MAASEDDAELAELRSAVLASLKAKCADKRTEQESLSSLDENSSQAEDDEDLEFLRLAALQTKKLSAFTATEAEDDSTYLPASPDEGLEVFPQRSNLIVIPLVHTDADTDLQTYPPLGGECDTSVNEHLPHNIISESVEGSPQQSKRDDKFSRFESDSDSDNEQSQSESSSNEMDDSGNQSEKRPYTLDTSESEEEEFEGYSRENKDNTLPSDADVSTGIPGAEAVLENKSLEGNASPNMNSVQEAIIADATERSDEGQQCMEHSHHAKTSLNESSPSKYSKSDGVDTKSPYSDLQQTLSSSFSPGKENLCGHIVDDSSSSQHECKHTSANAEDDSYSGLLKFKECSESDLGSCSRQSRHSHSSHHILDRRKHEVNNNLHRSHSQSPVRFCGNEKTEAKTFSRERSRSRSPLHAFRLPTSKNTLSEDDKGCRQGYDLLFSKKNTNANVSGKEKDSLKNRLGHLIPIPDEATLEARRRKFESQEVNVSSAEVKRISLKHIKLKSDTDKEVDTSANPIFKESQNEEKRSIEKRRDDCSEDHTGSSILKNLSSEKDNGVCNDKHSDSDDSVRRTKREMSLEKKTYHSSRTDGIVEKRSEPDTFSQRKELARRRHDLGNETDSNAKWSSPDGNTSLQEKLMSLAYGDLDNNTKQMEHFKNRDEVNENKTSLKYRLGPLKEDCKKSVSRTSRGRERIFDANVPYDPIAILKSVINDKKDQTNQTPVHLERYRYRMEKRDAAQQEDKMKKRSQSPQKDDSHAKNKRRGEDKTSTNVERKVLLIKGEEEESLQKRLPVHLRIGEAKQHMTVKKTFDCLVQQGNSKGLYQTEIAKQKQHEEPTASECGSWEMSKRSRNNEPASGLASQVAVPHRKERTEAQKDVSTDKESELDERIRKIQEKNAEILRRKQEIEADKKKYG